MSPHNNVRCEEEDGEEEARTKRKRMKRERKRRSAWRRPDATGRRQASKIRSVNLQPGRSPTTVST